MSQDSEHTSPTRRRANHLSPLKQALLALEEMQSRFEAIQRARTEPIAIIGLGCRFPGGANDPEAYWRLLRDGVDAITEIPPDRWDVDAYYDPDPEAPGKMYTRYGGFLDKVDKFDAQFFGISPREAVDLDPQQRLLLEVAWEALENAGQAPDKLAGSQTGVFIGVMENDYSKLHLKADDPTNIGPYYVTGNYFSFTAGRLSYILGLHGPSLALDTACSSSLVAIHLACQSLRSGESNLALAGGVNLLLSPELTTTMCKFKALSADGRCKTFDAAADGFGQAEGCGIMLLKRLSDAIADGDNILALIRGSAANHDGPSAGLTVPNGLAQQALIRQALANAGVEPAQVSYVEAHGTGTSLGDPIEVRALGAVLGKGRSENKRLIVGSAKTNLGHLDSAAGVAGLIKVVLSLQHEEIPPHLHFKEINPHISLDEVPMTIPTERIPWPAGKGPRIAGVSSFGLSGTNVHMVVEEAPPIQTSQPEVERSLHLLSLSAKSEDALRELAGRFERYLASQPLASLADVCFTANTGRSHFGHRLAVVGESLAHMQQKLAAFSAGHKPAGVLSGQIQGIEQPQVAFLFTGQGSQYVGMGRQLYDTQPTFRKALDRCNELLCPYLEQPLLSVLYPEPGSPSLALHPGGLLDETAYTQPALFALEYALAELWRAWGVEPAAVMGHSVGEYVAACVAGVFSLEDGLKLIAERGRLMQSLPKDGLMAVVFAGEAQVTAAVAPYAASVSIAAVNGPKSMVISGEYNAVQAVLKSLQAEGVRTQPLNVSHAFHSPLMEPILDTFRQTARQVQFKAPQIPLLSNLTGRMLKPDEIPDAAYWCHHIRQAVRFSTAVETLYQQGHKLFLEIGPNPILVGMGRRCIPDGEPSGVWLSSLRQNQADWQQILESLGQLYVHGMEIDWARFDQDYACGRRRVALPTYPFQRQSYWIEEAGRGARRAITQPRRGAALHPLLGQRLRSALKEIQFETQLSSDWPPFLADHQVYGAVVVPGTAFMEMALAAADAAFEQGGHQLEEITIREALTLSEARTVQLILTPDGAEKASFQVASLAEDDDRPGGHTWRLHVTGQVRLGPAHSSVPMLDDISLTTILARCQEELDVNTYYASLRELGLEYGRGFRGITRLWRYDGEVLGQVQLPDALAAEVSNYRLHPALLDAAFQLSVAALPECQETKTGPAVYLPVGLQRISVYQTCLSRLWGHVLVKPTHTESQESFAADIRLFDEAGQIVAEVESLYLKRVSREALQRAMRPNFDDWLYEVTWETQEFEAEIDISSSKRAAGNWLILTDQSGTGTALAERLQAQGETCTLVVPGKAYVAAKDGPWQVNPKHPDEIQCLLRDVLGKTRPLHGVVYLWGLDSEPGTETAQAQICGGALHLAQAMATVGPAGTSGSVELPGLWLVTRGAQPAGPDPTMLAVAQAPLWGLGGTIANEHPDLHCVRLDLDPWPERDESETLFNEIWFSKGEAQVAFRGNNRYVARLVRSRLTNEVTERRLALPADRPFRLDVSSPGLLDTLVFRPTAHRQPSPGEVEIRIRATGLNFKDVLKALGKYAGEDNLLGEECAGTITALGEGVAGLQVGDEVVAVAQGSFGPFVVTRAELVVPKPDSLSFAEAATIPITFLTAYYTLHHLAKMSAGKRVLIHAAAGGVGLAAVQLAQQAGAEIFATAGSPRKRALLRSMGVQHVMDSRTLKFADEVMALTDGRGVDIVLNSLAGDFIPKSLSVLEPDGCFLEIGRTGVWDESQVAHLRPHAAYFAFYLGDIVDEHPDLIQEMLRQLMASVQAGSLKPLPYRIFPLQEAISAFRYMAQAKHIGKIVLSQEEAVRQSDGVVQADATYLITGGLGGLGFKVAEWLVIQGARHLVLVGRKGAAGAAREKVRKLEQAGAQVVVAQADISQQEQITRVLTEIDKTMPPLRGIIHSAGVLDDGMLLQQTWDRFAKVLAPKVEGAWNLHTLTQNMALDFFVLFSSTASLLGMPGQGNYVAANAFLDALAHRRQAQGLPALSVNWGPWAEVGMVAAMDSRDQQRLIDLGMSTVTPEHGLQVLERLLHQASPQVAVLPIDWARFYRSFPAAQDLSLLTHLIQQAESRVSTDTKQGLSRQAIIAAAPSERQRLLETNLRGMVARVLQLPVDSIDVQLPLNNLGLDSLMALELQNRIESDLGVVVSMVKFLQGASVTQLTALLLDKLAETASTEAANAARIEKIVPRPDPTIFPLSAGQERLWSLNQLTLEAAVHNLTKAIRLRGALNVEILEQSLTRILERHETLRASFANAAGQPAQTISPAKPINLAVIDLRELSDTEREGNAQRLANEEAQRRFDLAKGPLLRTTLLRLGPEDHVLLLTMHHIISDGWSFGIFWRELSAFYQALLRGQSSPLPELSIQYADYAHWQQQWLRSEASKVQLAYWQQQLAGKVPTLQLPTDRAHPPVQTYQGASQSLILPKDLTEALTLLSRQEGVTLFVTLLTAFKTLLYLYSAQEDIVICSPIAGRQQVEIQDLIGYFNNIVVLRSDLSGNPTFRELLGRVHQGVLEVYEHQDLPFQTVAALPNLARTPLSRALFALNDSYNTLELPGITVSIRDVETGATDFDLSLDLKRTKQNLTGVLRYKTDLFSATVITQMLIHFQNLLESIVSDPEQRLLALPRLTERELQSAVCNLPGSANRGAGDHAILESVPAQAEPERDYVSPRDDLELQLTKIWEEVLDIQPIGVRDNFFHLGGHSLLAVRLFAEIDKVFNKKLPLAVLFPTPTIEQLAKTLRQEDGASSWFSLVPIQPGGSRPPLFGIHSTRYHPLARYLGPEQPLYALRYGLASTTPENKLTLPNRLEDLADHYVKEMRILQPEGPYFLIGLCIGSLIAFEMAQRLVTQGEQVALLALVDPIIQAGLKPLSFRTKASHLLQLGPGEVLKRAQKKVDEKLHRLNSQRSNRAQVKYHKYVPQQVYPGRAIIFKPVDKVTLSSEFDPALGWGELIAGGLEICEVPGSHTDLFEEPHVQALAETLKACLAQAQADVLAKEK
jgi:acyl transferase domain-containing protein/thioesterase domain-containing protein/acyl carrier protein